ncbi:MAG: bacterial Ig-like domain-containing protein [Eubacteriales bacterium]|nr:bacterial Ig-like domain-containing protein [Eubacteriales bacterium]
MALIKHDERYGPYMTANSAPAPFAATASQNSWGAFRAFSESLDDDISFTGLGDGTEQWVQIKLDAPIRIWAFRIACRTTVSAKDAGQVPKNFTVQGSTDGTTFVDIESYTDVDWEQFTSWDAEILKYDWADAKKIEITCNAEYQYYRFLFGECQSVSTQKAGSMIPTSANMVKPTLIDLYQVEGEAEPEITVTGIRITHGPDKDRYEVGADLDTTGLEVTADLSDGSTQIIADYTLSGYDSAATGQKTVTVAYQEHTAVFTVTVYELSSIAITTPPAKVEYTVGETLDLTGMVVTVTYSDGVAEIVTDYTVSGYDGSVAGTHTVTVGYQGETASFEVTVAEASHILREYIGSPNLEDVVAELDTDTWVLTISGYGAIRDFTMGDIMDTIGDIPSVHPPIFKEYFRQIKEIIVEEGITDIGECFIAGYSSDSFLMTISDIMTNSTTSNKIENCYTDLERVKLASSVTHLSEHSLVYTCARKEIELGSAQNITDSTLVGIISPLIRTKLSAENLPLAAVNPTCFGLFLPQNAVYDETSGFAYLENESGVTVIGKSGAMLPKDAPNVISIHESYNGNPVTSIDDAFGFPMSDGAVINVPDSVIEISSNSFGAKISKEITINIDAKEGDVSGAPWGAPTGTVINWTGVARQLTGITITSLPHKTQYVVGDSFDSTGLVVTANYDDGTTEVITEYVLSGFDSATEGTKTVTITYQGFTATFEVVIVAAGVTLESLLNTTEGMEAIRDGVKNTSGIPDKIKGVDWFVFNGNVVDNVYIYYTRWMGFGVSQAQLCICTTSSGCVNYVYRQQGTLDNDIEFLKIRVEGLTGKWSYEESYSRVAYEVFLFEDGYMFINVLQTPTRDSYLGASSITDGTNTQTLTIPINTTERNPVKITVQDAGKNQVVTYTQYQPAVITRIEVTTPPKKTTYYGNEVLDTDGLEVSTVDTNGNKRPITRYTLSGYDSTTPGIKTITVTKNALTATFTVNILEVKITGITVSTTKTQYFPKQELDLSTLTVNGNLSDGTMIGITKGYTFSGFDSSIPQICDVTAIYVKLTFSFTLTVMAPQEIVGAGYSYNSPIFIGDPCNLHVSRMTVEYENGEREEVTEGFEYTYPDTSTVGKKTIIVSYYTASRTFEIEVVRYLNAEVGTPNKSDVTMEFDCVTGLLTFQGTGEVSDFQYEANVPGSFRDKLKTIIASGDITGMQQTYLYSRSSVETVSLGEKIKEIPANMFMNCEGLKNIMFPSIESIGDQAFMGCSSLENLTLPDSISMLGARCFYGCGFEEFTIPDNCNVESLTQTFLSCKSLKSVYVGKNVKSISSGTFPYTDTPTITINNKEGAISGAPWDAPSGSTVVWLVKITSISITSLPDKTNYEIGEEFDPTGLTVSGMYSDGSIEIITNYTVSGFDSAPPGTKTITVTYNNLAATFEVGVFGAAIGIRISHYPNKVYYKIGDALDTTGLQVVAISEGGLERSVTDYTLSDLDSSTVGNKQISVTYEVPVSEDTKAVYFTDFTVKVTSDGQNPFEGDSVPYIITIHWPNGEFEDLTNNDIAGGNKAVTLKESICGNNYFIFGGCICNMIQFTTHSPQFASTDESAYPHGDIEVYVECKETKVKIFTGKIETGDRVSGLLTRDIIAYDHLYQYRNADIARWYRSVTIDRQMLLTQKQFRDLLFDFLGIEQIPAVLEYDNALVPDTNATNEMNVVSIIKDLCLQNSVFGHMNRDGKFEYLKLPENCRVKAMDNKGNIKYEYYEAAVHYDIFEECKFTEGRIWYPRQFYTYPSPYYRFSDGPPSSAQEAYENNVYYNRNSFFVGDEDWLDSAWQADEYGEATVDEPVFPICYGTTNKTDNQHLYRAQKYELPVRGNPLNKVGDSIEIAVTKTAEDGSILRWTINSYIMSRTLKLLGDTCMTDTYSASNGPYNGNDLELGNCMREVAADTYRTRRELPTIVYDSSFTDGATRAVVGKNVIRAKCFRQIEYKAYQSLSETEKNKPGEIFFTYEEEAGG